DRFHERYPGKDIPGSAEVESAAVLIDRSHHCAVHHPVIADTNLFHANVRQRELNRSHDRIAVETQQLVCSAICAGCMRANAKAVRNRLECLLLFVDTAPSAPPP